MALFDIEDNKESGLDGYTSKFFKSAWSVVGKDTCAAVREFFASGKLFGELKTSIISLIAKVIVPKKVIDYRLISCCNVVYKTISKGRIVGNKMHKAFPLPGESSHWQYKFPLPVNVVPTARRLEMPLPGVCTAIEEMMKKLPFSIEIKMALFDIEDNKESGLDGYTSKFFKSAWSVVGKDTCAAVREFFASGKLFGSWFLQGEKGIETRGPYFPLSFYIGYGEGVLPIRYLGVPMVSKMIIDRDCMVMVEVIRKRVGGWRNKLLSFAGRFKEVINVQVPIIKPDVSDKPVWIDKAGKEKRNVDCLYIIVVDTIRMKQMGLFMKCSSNVLEAASI
uniref:RNA-directed DNA polymerase, eukaryota, reverse transcriptase zinc-binding domain protein n=1 Tax=Tanacetum cinerariifolium TaxID=118510 RepID=A0A6L2K655_TANCI|nr:RNA-directed DNA polymerase, eukaryota, reverse transcriptase zinc-binding domain protein [Tanacetum cinerariifolium]